MTASAHWHIWNAATRLVSRKGNVYKSFPALCQSRGACLSVSDAVLDSGIVYLGPDGKPQFSDLMRRRGPQYFYAFDLLWFERARPPKPALAGAQTAARAGDRDGRAVAVDVRGPRRPHRRGFVRGRLPEWPGGRCRQNACSRVWGAVNCWNETFLEAYRVDERGICRRCGNADDIRTGEG